MYAFMYVPVYVSIDLGRDNEFAKYAHSRNDGYIIIASSMECKAVGVSRDDEMHGKEVLSASLNERE